MDEFMNGIVKTTVIAVILIFGMLLGVTSTEKDVERSCKKTGEYKTVSGLTIHCEKNPDAVPHEDKHHNHKH